MATTFADLQNKRFVGFREITLQDINTAKSISKQLVCQDIFGKDITQEIERHHNEPEEDNLVSIEWPKLLLVTGRLNEEIEMFVLGSTNADGMYAWFSDWEIMKLPPYLSLIDDPSFKFIGETINEVWVGAGLDSNNTIIDADKGTDWKYEDGINYMFISLRTNTKHLDLGTCFHECHYPDTIWEFI